MKITDEVLYRHAAEARDIWLDTLPKDDELPEHQFSDEFMVSLEALEVQEKAQHKKKSRRPSRSHLCPVAKAAAVAWLLDASSSSACASFSKPLPEPGGQSQEKGRRSH